MVEKVVTAMLAIKIASIASNSKKPLLVFIDASPPCHLYFQAFLALTIRKSQCPRITVPSPEIEKLSSPDTFISGSIVNRLRYLFPVKVIVDDSAK